MTALERVNVFKALELCSNSHCTGCAYHVLGVRCMDYLAHDALVVLKAQEARIKGLEDALCEAENAFKRLATLGKE